MPIQNNKQTLVITHDTANATYVVAGNNSVSNLVAAANSEVLSGASILSVFHGASNGAYWRVLRGANLVGVYVNSGSVKYSERDISINKDQAGNVVIQLVGTGDAYIMLELRKQGLFPDIS